MAKLSKKRNKLFMCKIQDENGNILEILKDMDKDQLWLKGTAEAKAQRGYWTMFDRDGRFIDGNYAKIENKRKVQ